MRTAVALIFWLASFQLMTGPVRAQSAAEQMHFSAEDETVKRPIILPDQALQMIERDPDVAEVMKNEEPPLAKLPRSWLMASEVHLDGPREKDIVIVAAGHLMGANVTTFWILRPTDHGFAILLTAPAHDLFIKGTRSNGYRDVEIAAATAVRVSTVTFRFDGNRYTKYKEHSEDIR
jgi:hypothetical protein